MPAERVHLDASEIVLENDDPRCRFGFKEKISTLFDKLLCFADGLFELDRSGCRFYGVP